MVSVDHGRQAGTAGRGSAVTEAVRKGTAPGLLILFLITVMLPYTFTVFGSVMSPVRAFLLVAFAPCMVQVLSGRVGRVTWVDILFSLHGFWLFLSYMVVWGPSMIPFATISAVELVGGYFLGRVLVRNEVDYRRLIRMTVIAIMIVLPMDIYETLTGKMLLSDLLRPIFDAPHRGTSARPRWGLERAYGMFEHPILRGLFCSIVLANAVLMVKGKPLLIVAVIVFVCFATFLSLSSAPLLSCALQIMMLAWGWLSKGRWRLLAIGCLLVYVFLELASNRGAMRLLIGTLTFDPGTGYTRLMVNDYAWEALKGAPFFGPLRAGWEKPEWLTDSIDNFWLVMGLRSGIIGGGLILGGFLLHLFSVVCANIVPVAVRDLRVGHVIALIGIMTSLTTVHMWGGAGVFIVFYVGAGAWLYVFDHGVDDGGGTPEPAVRSGPLYSRFAPVHVRAGTRQGKAGGAAAGQYAPEPVWRRTFR